MKIVVISAHPDDFLYGTAGTLMTHRDDERHVIVLAPIQRGPMIEVAEALGVVLHPLDGQYKHIDKTVGALLDATTASLSEIMPDYVLAPCASGDWSPDHTAAGAIAARAFVDSGTFGQWNGRLLRYPIPASTTRFNPNVWVKLAPSLLEEKIRLATIMVRGAEDIWPHEVVRWEVGTGHRFAQEVGWPAAHVEAFDALYMVPFDRLPPRDDSTSHLVDRYRDVVARIQSERPDPGADGSDYPISSSASG
jgi:hypothetical protein